jgi:signal transduction histidine kinase
METIYPEHSRGDFINQLVAIAQGHTSYQGQSVNNRLDGSELTVYLKWIAAPGHENDLSKVFLSLIDITPRVTMEKELSVSREQLRLINRNLRHDLTNYLSVIHSALKMYIDTPQEALLEEARDKVTRSISLIKDMRQLEVAFKKQSELTVHEVRAVLESVAAGYPSIPISIQGAGNVISNALVHSGTNRVDITIDQKQSNCIVRIVDYGKGIPDEMKEAVFNEGVHHGPSGHSGLGLYLVKETVERYHGSVHIEDALPWGTIVVITLRSYT